MKKGEECILYLCLKEIKKAGNVPAFWIISNERFD